MMRASVTDLESKSLDFSMSTNGMFNYLLLFNGLTPARTGDLIDVNDAL